MVLLQKAKPGQEKRGCPKPMSESADGKEWGPAPGDARHGGVAMVEDLSPFGWLAAAGGVVTPD